MHLPFKITENMVILVLLLPGIIWLMIRTLRKSEDAGVLIVKWVATALVLGTILFKAAPWMDEDGSGQIAGLMVTLLCAIALWVLWRQSLASLVADPFGALYDGGSRQIDPQAYYSIAEAKRKRGHYAEAIAEIRKQLLRFPTDVRGQLLLAEIQAEDLHDLPAAQETLQRFCSQHGHEPRNVAFAYNLLADFQLKYGLDPDSARQSLQQIITLFPGTDLAISANQRIAHLATRDRLLEAHERPVIPLPEGVKYVGLMQSSAHLAPVEATPEARAEKLVAHLEQHPLDAEAREQLATIYSGHYDRLDLATDQLEQLINLPNQPPKSVAHWLNLLADMQVRHGTDYEMTHDTLQRIVEMFPGHAAAALAQNRINKLKLEYKARETTPDVKMGTYEKNLGLKQGRPRRS